MDVSPCKRYTIQIHPGQIIMLKINWKLQNNDFQFLKKRTESREGAVSNFSVGCFSQLLIGDPGQTSIYFLVFFYSLDR